MKNGYSVRAVRVSFQGLLAAASISIGLLPGCGGDGSSASNSTGSSTGGVTLTRQEFAYVVNQDDNTVGQFKIGGNGVLAALTPPSVAAPANSVQVLTAPNGQFVYVLAQTPGTGAAVLAQYKVRSDGTLSALSPATVALGTLISGSDPTGNSQLIRGAARAVLDPAGKFLYVPTPAQILSFPVHVDGTLGSSTVVAQVATPIQAFAMDPKGRFAYIGSQSVAEGVFIAPFQIQADGSFRRIAGKDVVLAGSTFVAELALEPTGRFLYAASALTPDANGASNPALAQFQVQADGTLSLLKSTTFSVPANANGGLVDVNQFLPLAAIAAFHPAFDATGKFAYLPTGTPKVLAESIGSDGSLTPLPGSVLVGVNSTEINIEPSGLFVYVANQDTSISQFRRNADGSLTPLVVPAAAVGHRPISIATTILSAAAN